VLLPVTVVVIGTVTVPEPFAVTVNVQHPATGSLAAACNFNCVTPLFVIVVVGDP
jgi:hypothetical protein